MNVLITGGGGFLGQRLASELLSRGGLRETPGGQLRPLRRLVLLDQAFPERGVADACVETLTGDITNASLLARAFAGGLDAVFHLASVVSAGAEADFDLGFRVNVDGMRTVLEQARGSGSLPRLVFTSSVAAFGGVLPVPVVDATATRPQSSYGTHKVIGELLVADYTRKGFIDGRSLRLPTIVVRPGKPNRAASGFMSGILREPLNGDGVACPVPIDTCMWVLSPAKAIDALIRAMELTSDAWASDRVLNAPGITVSVREALAALLRIAGRDVAARVRFEPDAAIERIVLSWPARFVTERANRLGFLADADVDAIVRQYMSTMGR